MRLSFSRSSVAVRIMQPIQMERPTIPFGLSLAGFIISSLAALVIGLAGRGMFGSFGYGNMLGGMMGGYYGTAGMMNGYAPWGMSSWGGYTWMWVFFIAASLVLGAIGVIMMNTSRLGDLRLGSALV